MNFKPSLWKILVSIIIGGLISLWNYAANIFGDLIKEMPSLGTSILIILVSAVIVYIIWSLFQRK
ncbi:hypothetical protein CL621_04950 [archaeon]|nr:hypothetical protein [archaeon]|tara:strand:+ start:1003 stop:1197 length:195 start_codon:yes stop_codon:yes gene_type:complete